MFRNIALVFFRQIIAGKRTFNATVLVNQQVRALQITVNENRIGAMQPVHAECCVLGHFHARVQAEFDILISQHFLNITMRQELGDNKEVARNSARTHEQADVRVENCAEEKNVSKPWI